MPIPIVVLRQRDRSDVDPIGLFHGVFGRVKGKFAHTAPVPDEGILLPFPVRLISILFFDRLLISCVVWLLFRAA